MQHNCRDLECAVTRTRRTFQEKELTKELANEITHQPGQDYILNTSQMRNSTLVQFFRAPAPILDRPKIILESVKVEIDAEKQRKKPAPVTKSRAQTHNPQTTPLIPSSSHSILPRDHPIASSSSTSSQSSHNTIPNRNVLPPQLVYTSSSPRLRLPVPTQSHPSAQHVPHIPVSSLTYTYPQFRRFVPSTPSSLNPQSQRPQ